MIRSLQRSGCIPCPHIAVKQRWTYGLLPPEGLDAVLRGVESSTQTLEGRSALRAGDSPADVRCGIQAAIIDSVPDLDIMHAFSLS